MGSRAQKARLQRLRPGSPVRHGTEHTPCNPNRTDACATSQPAEYKPEGRPEYTWSRRARGCRAVHHWLSRSLSVENSMLISATPGIFGRWSGSRDQRYWMRDKRATCGIPAGSLLAAWFGGSFLSLGVPLSRCANDLVAPLFQPVHASPTRATTTRMAFAEQMFDAAFSFPRTELEDVAALALGAARARNGWRVIWEASVIRRTRRRDPQLVPSVY